MNPTEVHVFSGEWFDAALWRILMVNDALNVFNEFLMRKYVTFYISVHLNKYLNSS